MLRMCDNHFGFFCVCVFLFCFGSNDKCLPDVVSVCFVLCAHLCHRRRFLKQTTGNNELRRHIKHSSNFQMKRNDDSSASAFDDVISVMCLHCAAVAQSGARPDLDGCGVDDRATRECLVVFQAGLKKVEAVLSRSGW
jgi:hypothetical protein